MTEQYYEWARAEPRALARYVQPKGLPEEFKLPKYINRLDLLRVEGPRGRAAQLYEQICKQNIQYDLAPFNPLSEASSLRMKAKQRPNVPPATPRTTRVSMKAVHISGSMSSGHLQSG